MDALVRRWGDGSQIFLPEACLGTEQKKQFYQSLSSLMYLCLSLCVRNFMVQSSSISMKTMTIAGLQSLEGEEGTLPIEVYCGA